MKLTGAAHKHTAKGKRPTRNMRCLEYIHARTWMYLQLYITSDHGFCAALASHWNQTDFWLQGSKLSLGLNCRILPVRRFEVLNQTQTQIVCFKSKSRCSVVQTVNEAGSPSDMVSFCPAWFTASDYRWGRSCFCFSQKPSLYSVSRVSADNRG